MNGIEIFAFIILPATVAIGGWVAVLAKTQQPQKTSPASRRIKLREG
ncbi:hypothetical protein [Rhizobium mesosinicum]|uniref:Uncharacterized protein n=1 Tax=Rhizobium mesosinicum TaxID=335017 RepID=A0ABS7GT24_9HYPH|nr:hypothetical protein [Rhizobium mesosinicum]MBW9053107.1 hypothetical protein [Rhizobium mesosinicum]